MIDGISSRPILLSPRVREALQMLILPLSLLIRDGKARQVWLATAGFCGSFLDFVGEHQVWEGVVSAIDHVPADPLSRLCSGSTKSSSTVECMGAEGASVCNGSERCGHGSERNHRPSAMFWARLNYQ